MAVGKERPEPGLLMNNRN